MINVPRWIAAVACICSVLAVDLPRHLAPDTTDDVQTQAVNDLIIRAIGTEATKHFVVNVDRSLALRSYRISKTADNKIDIIGADGVSVAKAFHNFMKYYLKEDITWSRAHVQLPDRVELPDIHLASTSASSFIYYQNVCTWGYTFTWWDWSSWRRHIDWMAMMGITLTIEPIQEYVWHDVYLEMGLNESEIADHFAGPAFQPWQRMGNIRGWAGPLPATYRHKQMLLQKRILKAQRDLGMSVALPAFAGHVPVAMQRIYTNVSFTPVSRWNRFPDSYCCSLFLDPNEPLFRDIAVKFLQRINEIYGSNHIYFADPFNEVQPRLASADYLNMTAFHIYESMRAVDNAAIWLLQGWMFVKNIFWTDELIAAFLKAVPQGKLLVLDLQSEQFPQYEVTKSFHGQPFIWCMLHNFGGTLGMHGSVEIINSRIRMARDLRNSSMIGVGITPEGIHQNYVMYALCLERAWQLQDFNLEQWFANHSDITYGVADARLRGAWRLLQKSVYSYYGTNHLRGRYAITRRPSLNLDIWTWYNITAVQQAWTLFLSANESVPLPKHHSYEHDLVDITRQYLQALADQLYLNLKSAFAKKQLDRFLYVGRHLRELLYDLENILASNEHFLLGPWLESAKQQADTDIERELFEMNARNQITSWGPTGQILDYATKQWSGIIEDYYAERWNLFLDMLEISLRNHTRFDSDAFKAIVREEIENPFSVQTKSYPTKPTGITLQISQNIHDKWQKKLENSIFLHYCRLTVHKINLQHHY